MIWNNLNPLSRKPLIDRNFGKPNLDALEFYKNLALDSRVEFLAKKDERYKEIFWSMHENDDELRLEMQVLRSESLHHQNFYLREGFDKEEQAQ